ncbi:MAG: hypothetical protein HY327_10055 [Chloroflexi bacterium]|nr:hypothetical protein [Chloroflexota bacterium]
MNSKVVFVFASVLALAACSGPTNDAARQPTQTPWIIFVPVTATPEPVVITPLPTVTQGKAAATPAPTRAATVRPAPSRTFTAVPVVVQPTSAPACNIGTVRLTFPENGAPRSTKRNAGGGDAFIFNWEPPAALSGFGDAKVGYQLDMVSRRTGTNQVVNGATKMISNNKFLENRKQFVFEKNAVKSLAAGDDASVEWKVTVVRATGSFDDASFEQVPAINCGPPSETRTIKLEVVD